jgi:hypothetical protein
LQVKELHRQRYVLVDFRESKTKIIHNWFKVGVAWLLTEYPRGGSMNPRTDNHPFVKPSMRHKKIIQPASAYLAAKKKQGTNRTRARHKANNPLRDSKKNGFHRGM